MNDDLSTYALIAVAAWAMLIAAPPVPPNVAVFTGLGLAAIVALLWYGYQHAFSELIAGWRAAAEDEVDEEQQRIEAAREAYAEGELTDAELEERIDEIVEGDP